MNGWKNYETWNVALWLQNDYGLYSLTKEWIQDRERMGYSSAGYDNFVYTLMELYPFGTDDKVAWNDPKISHDELTEMMAEL